MKLFLAFFGVVSAAALVGCAVTEAGPSSGDSADALRRFSSVRLPDGDPCRDVLGPVALGLARGLTPGRTRTEVSLTEDSYRRVYTVEVQGAAKARWRLELDNDSSFMCYLNDVDRDDTVTLAVGETRTVATASELALTSAPLVSPAGDPCEHVLALLATGAALSHVSPSYLLGVEVRAVSGTPRDYSVAVDGASFVANGVTFANDSRFAVSFEASATATCGVQRMYPTP